MAKAEKSVKDLFKPVSLKKLKEQIDKDDVQANFGRNNNYLEFDDGKTNKIRLFPPHPGKDVYYVIEKKHFVPQEKNDGEMGKTAVLNSITHGGTKLDVIDEYIKFAKANIKDQDKLKKVTANSFKGGLYPSVNWVAYAFKVVGENKEFGLVQLKKSVRDAMNKACFVEDDGEPIEVDPFTDPEEGLPLLIKYNAKPNTKKGEDYYETSVSKKAFPLDEEELQDFLKVKPLEELYLNVYTIKEFEKALEGLQLFDTEHELDIFESDDWNEIVEAVKAQYDDPFETDDEEDKKKSKKKVTKKEEPKKSSKKKVEEEPEEEEEAEEEAEEEEEEEEKGEGDEFDEMDRDELKAYIKKNSLEIKIMKNDTEDDLRTKIREATATEEEETEESEEEAEEEEEEAKPTKGKLTMAQIKAKLKDRK